MCYRFIEKRIKKSNDLVKHDGKRLVLTFLTPIQISLTLEHVLEVLVVEGEGDVGVGLGVAAAAGPGPVLQVKEVLPGFIAWKRKLNI